VRWLRYSVLRAWVCSVRNGEEGGESGGQSGKMYSYLICLWLLASAATGCDGLRRDVEHDDCFRRARLVKCSLSIILCMIVERGNTI
jgi:hypothetical protein